MPDLVSIQTEISNKKEIWISLAIAMISKTVTRSYCSMTERAASSVPEASGRGGGGDYSENIYGGGRAACFMKSLPYFIPRHVIFDTLFQT